MSEIICILSLCLSWHDPFGQQHMIGRTWKNHPYECFDVNGTVECFKPGSNLIVGELKIPDEN